MPKKTAKVTSGKTTPAAPKRFPANPKTPAQHAQKPAPPQPPQP